MLAWIGIALLSVSWLVGLGYYHPANWPAWAFLAGSGTLLLATARGRLVPPWQSAAAALLAFPSLLVASGPQRTAAPWPYWAPLALVCLGSLLGFLAGLRWLARPAPPERRGGRNSRQSPPERAPAPASLPQKLLGRLGTAALLAGCVLLVQALGMMVYATVTARSHELPPPFPWMLGLVARALGADSAVYQSTIVLFSMRETHQLGATWELLLDPVTWCFLLGGSVLVGWWTWSGVLRREGEEARPGARPRAFRLALARFAVPILAWLPLRAGLYMGIFLHGVLRTEYSAPLVAMRVFWNTWIHLALLAGPVLLAWRLVPRPAGEPPPAPAGATPRWRLPLAGLLAAAAAAALTAAVLWEPVGERKAGRVMFEEYHPEGDKQWERTDKPFDTRWYGHDSAYTYYCIYDYCGRFYKVWRRTTPLNEDALADCDVLIVKVPTRPYARQEIVAIEKFVREGGGLMLIGEHTDVFGTGASLNSISRQFGFTFRPDCLFGIDKVFEQRYDLPLAPHPLLAYMPPPVRGEAPDGTERDEPSMDFATSCSIDPGTSWGRAAIRSAGLKSKTANYFAYNFYPSTSDTAAMRYGAFVQLWTMRHGRGRIAAFTDSTIFSNFSAFEPGKKELWMGMVEWLNHRSPPLNPRWPLAVLGVPLAGCGLWVARRSSGAWLVLLASGLLAWSATVLAVNAAHRRGMPALRPERPLIRVTMDESISRPDLPRNGFINGVEKPLGLGIFERWILRLGYFTARRTTDVLQGDLVVFARPVGPVSKEFRSELLRYVEKGGKVLVVDTPQEASPEAAAKEPPPDLPADPEAPPPPAPDKGSSGRQAPTTNELLEPFRLRVEHATSVSGVLTTSEGWPAVRSEDCAVVAGGTPFAWVDGRPVAASVPYGKQGGSVTVVGYGRRLADSKMGTTGDVEPEKVVERLPAAAGKTEKTYDLREVYEWQYGLLRRIVEGKPLGQATSPPPKPIVKPELLVPAEPQVKP